MSKKSLKIFLILLFLILLLIFYLKFFNEDKIEKSSLDDSIQKEISSNIIKEISFSSKDKKGNEYILKAKEGEIFSFPSLSLEKKEISLIILDIVSFCLLSFKLLSSILFSLKNFR